jgi:hypothetical protein
VKLFLTTSTPRSTPEQLSVQGPSLPISLFSHKLLSGLSLPSFFTGLTDQCDHQTRRNPHFLGSQDRLSWTSIRPPHGLPPSGRSHIALWIMSLRALVLRATSRRQTGSSETQPVPPRCKIAAFLQDSTQHTNLCSVTRLLSPSGVLVTMVLMIEKSVILVLLETMAGGPQHLVEVLAQSPVPQPLSKDDGASVPVRHTLETLFPQPWL